MGQGRSGGGWVGRGGGRGGRDMTGMGQGRSGGGWVGRGGAGRWRYDWHGTREEWWWVGGERGAGAVEI